MMRNKMLSVAIVTMAFVAFAGVAEAAGSRGYDLVPGGSDQYMQSGSNFQLVEQSGNATLKVTHITGSTHLVEVFCENWSPADCIGTVTWD